MKDVPILGRYQFGPDVSLFVLVSFHRMKHGREQLSKLYAPTVVFMKRSW
jgi:hypothetical protein